MWRFIPIIFFLAFAACGEKGQGTVGEEKPPLSPEMRALDSISTIIDKNPGNTDLLNERAKMLVAMGNLDYALTDIGRALLMDSTKSAYYLTIADIYFQRNEPKRCLSALEKARTLDPLSPRAVQPLPREASGLYRPRQRDAEDRCAGWSSVLYQGPVFPGHEGHHTGH
jgi:tetratricopeptide (TPR) repeat protein